jgi:4-hydroxy-4-methyl-2-oxoglutarate aldolase
MKDTPQVPPSDVRATRPSGANPTSPNGQDSSPEMAEICARYKRLYAGLLFDVLEHLGLTNQALSHEIMPISPEMKLSGPAFTFKGTTTAVKDESVRYRRLNALKEMRFPCIEVRDRTTPFNVALYGELSATSAAAHGAVGALMDGGTRDSGMLISMGFPVFARYRSPVEAFGRVMTLAHQVPILMSGELSETVVVNPGDFVFGDIDGVIIVPKDLTVAVLQEAERIAGIEDAARVDFKKGEDPVEVFKRHRRL